MWSFPRYWRAEKRIETSIGRRKLLTNSMNDRKFQQIVTKCTINLSNTHIHRYVYKWTNLKVGFVISIIDTDVKIWHTLDTSLKIEIDVLALSQLRICRPPPPSVLIRLLWMMGSVLYSMGKIIKKFSDSLYPSVILLCKLIFIIYIF